MRRADVALAAMVDLELTRVPRDRRLFELPGVGTLRLKGLGSRAAIATAHGATWRMGRPRFWLGDVEAVDAAGTTIGSFRPRALRRGGTLVWADREMVLRPASQWRERYALAKGERELAIFEGKGWGSKPVRIRLDDDEALEPALLLFTAFVVRGLAEDASGAAGAAAGVAAIG
jgi:hypothetical protein